MKNLVTIKILTAILFFNSCASSVITNGHKAQQETYKIANNYFSIYIYEYSKYPNKKLNPYYLFKSEDSIFSHFIDNNEKIIFLKSCISPNNSLNLDSLEVNYIFSKKNIKSYKKQLHDFELDVIPKEILNDSVIKFPHKVTKKKYVCFL